MRFRWSAQTASGDAIMLDPVSTRSNTSQLRLPPFLFAAGRVQLRVTSWLSSNVAQNTSAVLDVEVQPTPEVFASISGGSFRIVDTSSQLVLDARGSEDPDDPNVEWDSVAWTCVNESVALAPGPCWDGHASDGLLWNLTAQLRTSAPSVLKFSVTLTSGSRNDTAEAVVEIVSLPVPSVSISDLQAKYSPSLRVVLRGSAESTADPLTVAEAGVALSPLSFAWSGWPCTDAPCAEPATPFDLLPILSTPLDNKILVVRPDSLPSGSTYRFRLEVSDGRATGVCQVDIVMNVAPVGGAVAIDPADGLAVTDTFEITATGWADEDIPLLYSFGYVMPGSDAETPLTEASNSPSTSSILGVGPEAASYQYTVHVVVSDAYAASSRADTDVTVRPYVPSASIAEDAGNLLAAAATSSNVQATTQLVGAFAASLNVEEEPADGAPALSAEEEAARVAQAAATRALLADSLLSVAASAADGGAELSEGVVSQVASGLAAVTAKPEEMTTDSLDSSFDAVKLLTSGGDGPSGAAVDSLAAATSNLLMASTSTAVEIDTEQAKEYATQTKNIVEQLSKALVSDAMPGEEPTSVSTDSFDLSSQKNYADSFAGAPLPISGSRRRFLAEGIDIVVPEGVFDNAPVSGDEPVDAMVTAWGQNPFGFADTSNLTGPGGEGNLTLGTSVLGFEFASSGTPLELRDLEKPFVLSLAPAAGVNASNDTTAFCSHWDVALGEWVVDTRFGPGNITADGGIVCEFDHLTDFSAFLGDKPVMNRPCFSCLDQLFDNPAGLFVTIVMGSLLIFLLITSIVRYFKFSHLTPKEIAAMKFAKERVQVMSPDEDYMSSCSEDISHRIRHDYMCGGILCQIPGDPFDWSQRALVFVTTLIVSFMVSLLFFRPPAPACTEVCQEMTDGFTPDPEALTCPTMVCEANEVCEMVCVESPKNGVLVSIYSAVISTPLVVVLGVLFKWLRKPVVKEIEPETVSMMDAVKVVCCCFKSEGRHLGSSKNLVQKIESAEKYLESALGGDEEKERVASGRNKSANVLVVDRSAFTIESSSDEEGETLAPPPAPMTMAELRQGVAEAQARWRQQEQSTELPLFFTPGAVETDADGTKALPPVKTGGRGGVHFSDVDKVKTLEGGEEQLPIPWLDGEQADPHEEDGRNPKPRPCCFAFIPIFYGFAVGSGALLVVMATAAGLGPENTKLWLISAFMSLVIKVFIADPIKVVFLTAFLQWAEDSNRNTLAKALEEKAHASIGRVHAGAVHALHDAEGAVKEHKKATMVGAAAATAAAVAHNVLDD